MGYWQEEEKILDGSRVSLPTYILFIIIIIFCFSNIYAPPRFAITVQEYFNEAFQNRWAERGSQPPVDWPSRSPDLTSCDNTLERVLHEPYQNIHQLKDAIWRVFATITEAQFRIISQRRGHHIILCHEKDGIHKDLLNEWQHQWK